MLIGEAEKEHGADNITTYTSTFTPMLYAITERKPKCSMKLICAGPEEKVKISMPIILDNRV